MDPVSDLQSLLRSMEPVLNPGTYVFASLPHGASVDLERSIAFIREPEGTSVIMEESKAHQTGVVPDFRCAWITLSVNSDLEAVGLTASFAAALGDAGISCNVVAGTNHDHIFVPVGEASAAMEALRALQRLARATGLEAD